MSRDSNITELEVKIRHFEQGRGAVDTQSCVIKKGPRAYKVVTLNTYADMTTGEVRKYEFRCRTFSSKWNEQGFDFSKPEYSWHCQDEEIEKLRIFLNEGLPEAGKYQLVRANSDFAELLKQMTTGGIDVDVIARLVESARSIPDFTEALAASDQGRLLAEAVEVRRRRASLERLRQIIEDPSSTETDIHKQLTGHPWVFGGQYVGEALRKELTTGDILDIPLLRADGSLQIVELKKANIAKLVVRHRSHLIPGPPVHEAVCQAQNYLRSLDESRDRILTTHKIECRRSFATVVIGHATFAHDVDAQQVAETLRTYNSHQSRVEVMTFDQLLAGANQALNFVPPDDPAQREPAPWESPSAVFPEDPPF